MEEAKDEHSKISDSLLLQPPSPKPRSQSIEIDLANTLVELSQLKAHPDDDESEQTWHVCCSRSEKGFIKFVVQVAMGFSVILFCMLMIGFGNKEYHLISFTLMSTTMALFFPHPSMTNEVGQ